MRKEITRADAWRVLGRMGAILWGLTADPAWEELGQRGGLPRRVGK